MKAPNTCPMCGESDGWKLIDTSKKGFNSKNAIIGGVLLGGIGLVAGFSGKQKSTYQCAKCGFSHEYDGGVADKDQYAQGFPPKGYKNSGMNSVYIDIMRKVMEKRGSSRATVWGICPCGGHYRRTGRGVGRILMLRKARPYVIPSTSFFSVIPNPRSG